MGRSLSYESLKKAQISDLKVSIVLADSGWRTEKGQKLLHSSGSSARILQHAAPHTVLKIASFVQKLENHRKRSKIVWVHNSADIW